ncbi:MAG: OFA family MFS transporter [Flavonifractor sp.]|nr:OFA family MFS transporter [Flavonifractor sp.]
MEQKLTRWPRLLVPAVCMLFAGVIYAWSVLKTPLGAEFGWNESVLALNFTLTLCFFCIGGIFGGHITKKVTAQAGLLISAVLVGSGFILTSALSGSTVMLYGSYAGLAGTGIGIAYNILISTTNIWFPDKKGTCSGVLMMCFGLSSLLLGAVADTLFSTVGWRNTFLLLGLVIAAVIALCSFGIRLPPSGLVLPQPKQKAYAQDRFSGADITTREMVRRSSFWRFFVFSVLTSASGSSIISFARDLAIVSGAKASLATMLVGVLSLCNGFGRILCGIVSDTFGVRAAMLISNTIAIAAPLAVLFAVNWHSIILCVAGLCLTGIAYGFLATIISAFTVTFYGPTNFSSNYSISNMMLFPAAFGATLASVLLTQSGGYSAPILMLAAFAAAAMAINLTIRKP